MEAIAVSEISLSSFDLPKKTLTQKQFITSENSMWKKGYIHLTSAMVYILDIR